MTTLATLIARLLQLDAREERQAALKAAEALWEYPYEGDILETQQRDAYISALFYVADYFEFVGRLAHRAVGPLTRAYTLDDGHFDAVNHSSAKEAAAYKLGQLYEGAKCHHNAVHWFKRSLALASTSGVKEHVLLNLNGLARNLDTLHLHQDAREYYDAILEAWDGSPSSPSIEYVVHAAMHHVHHADSARGEAIMHTFTSDYLARPRATHNEALPEWPYSASHALGMHYIATGRFQEAVELARLAIDSVRQHDEMRWVRDAMHGLIARAFVHEGQFDIALTEMAPVLNIDGSAFGGYADDRLVANRELLLDTARIHVAKGDYHSAIADYAQLAYTFGAVIADPHQAPTHRLRYYWLTQKAVVVHEMASVWLSISDLPTRASLESTVANALLQLKADIFIAIERHKGGGSSHDSMFSVTREYAAAARALIPAPNPIEAILTLEDRLFRREDCEKILRSGEYLSAPGMAAIFTRDFRELYILDHDTLVLDYSLINYRLPREGLGGPLIGQRYVGVRLERGSLRIVDLGEAEQIEAICRPLIHALSRPPHDHESEDTQEGRHLSLVGEGTSQAPVMFASLAESAYARLVVPFEPLKPSLLFSPDGMVAALPFHALIHDERYLVEDRAVAYCHSLLQRESLYMRHISSTMAVPPPVNTTALVLGNPSYARSELAPLPGTRVEVKQVTRQLRSQTRADGKRVYDDVRVCTRARATVSQLLKIAQPNVVHIAAHGAFDNSQTRLFPDQTPTIGRYYRRWQAMGVEPLTELDTALLQSTLFLANDVNSEDDPASGSLLTALELAALNFTHCEVVVLSACETGAGATTPGAGVLGFQYALQACCARAGLLSLWKVLDRDTSAFMVDVYRNMSEHGGIKDGYLASVRRHCRRGGQRLHPYYWAAFLLLDQEYEPWALASPPRTTAVVTRAE